MTLRHLECGRRRCAAALLSAGLWLMQGATAWGMTPPSADGQETAAALDHIPTLAGSTLSGEKLELPRDLGVSGRSAVLVVGFGRGASGATRDWGQHLAEVSAEMPSTTYYVLPVVSGVPSFFRGGVLRAIAHSVTPNGRRHFLPIANDEAGWRRVTGVQDESVPYLLLVDGKGAVHWRGSGAFSDATYKAMREQVSALDDERPVAR